MVVLTLVTVKTKHKRTHNPFTPPRHVGYQLKLQMLHISSITKHNLVWPNELMSVSQQTKQVFAFHSQHL